MRGFAKTLRSFMARWGLGSKQRQLTLPFYPAVPSKGDRSAGATSDAGVADTTTGEPTATAAGLARVFDAAHPVRTRSELFGRDVELRKLLQAAIDLRQHTIIHGSRGSGKTSLARIFGDYADQRGVIVIYFTCEDGATFAELMTPYLRAVPASVLAAGRSTIFRQLIDTLPADFGPRAFAELVGENVAAPMVFILDEFDRLKNEGVKADVSTAMKMLSDSLAEVLLSLVGIAETVDDIVAAHPSLRRHLQTVALKRIPSASVEALVDRSGALIGLPFSEAARALIVRATCGSPYHVRLFCLNAALEALRNRTHIVGPTHVLAGLQAAFVYWSGMNGSDASAFVEIARMRDYRQQAEAIASEMAATGSVTLRPDPAFSRTVALLGDVLSSDVGGRERLLFEDASAPQFLLALLIVTENRNDADVYADLESEVTNVFVD